MTTIKDVKQTLLTILKANIVLQDLLKKDSGGNWPIYQSFVQHAIYKPCVTIEGITDQAEVSALNDGYDGAKRYQWQHAVIQIDCWSMKNAEERDSLAVAVMKCLLKNPVSGTIYVQEPTVTALDEMDVKPPLWRKSLRFKVMYVMEA